MHRPTADVVVSLGGSKWTVRALLDTGAPFTLFDRGTADALGVDFSRRDARREFHKIAGDEYLAQLQRVQLTLPPFDDLAWTTDVFFFLDDWGMPFSGLFGQSGFFDRWVGTFHFPHSFVIEEPESFVQRLPVDEEQWRDLVEWQELGWKGPPPPAR